MPRPCCGNLYDQHSPHDPLPPNPYAVSLSHPSALFLASLNLNPPSFACLEAVSSKSRVAWTARRTSRPTQIATRKATLLGNLGGKPLQKSEIRLELAQNNPNTREAASKCPVYRTYPKRYSNLAALEQKELVCSCPVTLHNSTDFRDKSNVANTRCVDIVFGNTKCEALNLFFYHDNHIPKGLQRFYFLRPSVGNIGDVWFIKSRVLPQNISKRGCGVNVKAIYRAFNTEPLKGRTHCRAQKLSRWLLEKLKPTLNKRTGGQTMANYQYKMVQIPPNIAVKAKDYRESEAADYLEELANHYASQGWEFYRVDEVGVVVKPGCLGSLFGRQVEYLTYYVVTFRRTL